ncbi:MAG: type I-U CRISPR-associated protein Csx17 [Thermodesulfobacteriota bacterium]
MPIHDLDGCAPVPLAHYLKALGILRLVAEQADPAARGWWEGERFRLMSSLSREELEAFVLERYEPTPLVSPWNKGSGFYANDPVLAPVEGSAAPRLGRLRAGIRDSREPMDQIAKADQAVRAIKAETKVRGLTAGQKKVLKEAPEYKRRLAAAEKHFKTLKAELIPRLRLAWRGPHREWMDAAMVLGDDGTPQFPALLGTGGNDGRLDFTNNFFQRLGEMFDLAADDGKPRVAAGPWLRAALWGTAAAGCQADKAVGQYLPGMAGGANSSNGPDAKSLLNPMDFLLMLEGTLLFTAHATRRLGAAGQSRAAAPFVVGAQGAGYASAAGADEAARGEQWMPLWTQPVTLGELRRLLAEGRAQTGRKPVNEPLDMARAVARLGIARGITAFQRYGYIERNGQSNLAVPLGRFRVPDRVSPRLICLDDLDAWLPRLRRQARAKEAPARMQQVERRLADALFATTQHPDEPARWQAVLLALAAVEGVMVTGSGYGAGPVPALRPEWVVAADDGSPELRLAIACALQAAAFRSEYGPVKAVRSHWLPVKQGRFAVSGTAGQLRLQVDSKVVMHGRAGLDDAIALVERRLVDASQRGERRLPLVAAKKAEASPVDLGLLVANRLDLDRTMALARALMAVDGRRWAATPSPPSSSAKDGQLPDDAWLALRLAMLPWPLPDGRQIGVDPAIFRRLAGGDASTAVELALRRLRAAGITTALRFSSVPAETARLWAAALAFPIHRRTATAFVRRLDPSTEQGDIP